MTQDHGDGSRTPITQDEQPDSRRTSSRRVSSVLEATELFRIRSQYSRASNSYRAASARSLQARPVGLWRLKDALSKFWRSHISVVVAHEACRDHLALERTFLGYLRTSLALSMIGVTVAQLFRLQHSPNPDAVFGFYVLGKPLSCICQGSAIYSLLLGAFRCWRHQHAMVRGKAIAGGFEVLLLGCGVFMICLMFFVLLVAVDISREF